METSRYLLEKYSGVKSRYTCPNCGKPRQFTRYINLETGEHLADHVGICNRANKCGYHFPPSNYYFQENPSVKRLSLNPAKPFVALPATQPCATPDFIPQQMVEKSLQSAFYPQNNLISFLIKRCGTVATHCACKRLRIGTAKRWPGATIFWKIDVDGHVRTGKIMLYSPETGKRVKNPYSHITWAHTLLNVSEYRKTQGDARGNSFKLEQCLFGLHQLSVASNSTVIIVESEKTALIATIYLPQYTWMACGGLKNLSAKTLLPIKHCPILLYPDINAFNEWENKASRLRNEGFQVRVSTLLETLPRLAENKRFDGLDLADFLLLQPPPKSPLDTLIDKNPLLLQLVERFNLVPVNA